MKAISLSIIHHYLLQQSMALVLFGVAKRSTLLLSRRIAHRFPSCRLKLSSSVLRPKLQPLTKLSRL